MKNKQTCAYTNVFNISLVIMTTALVVKTNTTNNHMHPHPQGPSDKFGLGPKLTGKAFNTKTTAVESVTKGSIPVER